ncbi:MAG: DUF447 family protein [Planctomycetia bacterium]|nr:DUF447 family protein [Planctomycetia bacterium]
MILEGLMTTINADGTPNVSPMGPRVDLELKTFVLRPFQTSTTYRNVKRSGVGVFHVTDDVELLARAAVGKLSPLPPLEKADAVEGFILSGACRWFALRVESLDDSAPRTTITMRAVASGTLRDFFGLNRAKHAVVEGAILATRLHLLSKAEILRQFADLKPLVEKTGGEAEHRAFAFLERFIREADDGVAPLNDLERSADRTEVAHD